MNDLEYDQLFTQDGGIEKQIDISIGMPQPSKKGDYSCRFRMVGLGQNLEKDVFGVSKPQALALAMELANYLILNSEEFAQGKIFCRFRDETTSSLQPQMITVIDQKFKEKS